ncbi:MAG: aminoglycoside phosphotransferase family protein [bacterium]
MDADTSTKINNWWQKQFPDMPLLKIQELAGGQSHPCFLINESLVLKIYVRKYSWSNNSLDTGFNKAQEFQTKLSSSGFTPKILGIYENDVILEADAILMEYISGVNLSTVLYQLTEDQMFENGQLVGGLIQKINETEVLENQPFNTQELIDEIKTEFNGAKQKGLLYKEIEDFYNDLVLTCKPRIVQDNFVLVHGDIHPENLIITDLGLKLIDFDVCSFGPRFQELRILLHAACIPADLVPEELEPFYLAGILIPWFKGLISAYPELIQPEFFNEIKLIAFLEILGKFNLGENIGDKDTPRSRGMEMFRLVFEEKLLGSL